MEGWRSIATGDILKIRAPDAGVKFFGSMFFGSMLFSEVCVRSRATSTDAQIAHPDQWH